MAESTAVELTASDPADVVALHDLYGEYEWWADRTRSEVARALSNSVGVGLQEGDELVAGARLLTDSVHYARLYDVVVAADRRGDGLGRQLVWSAVEHPAVGHLNVVLLCREGLIPFYERCGFERYDLTTDIAGAEEEFVQMARWRTHPARDETPPPAAVETPDWSGGT
ncbi:N-acetyltransferase [Halobacteriales archaeon QS_4_70_19]|nr:MAG: N-acetyltransferase [Halobacteriales archaeon QS_4_70_19]